MIGGRIDEKKALTPENKNLPAKTDYGRSKPLEVSTEGCTTLPLKP